MPGSLLPSTASRQKYAAYGTDYGGEYQHVLLLHSTPSNSRAGAPGGGVQLSALNPRSTGKACQAFQIADFYMKSRCPDWSRRYETTLQEYRRYACCRRFSWRVDGEILFDPDGYAQMRGEAVMADLLGSCP